LTGAGRLVRVATDGTTQPVTGPVADTRFAARSIAIDPSNTSAALVAKDGTSVRWGALAADAKEQAGQTFSQAGTNLLQPSWDPFGLLWLVDMKDGRASLSVANGRSTEDGQPIPSPVQASGLEGLVVRAFAVSRDGMRLAAVIGRGAESRLVVGMIERPSDTKKQTPVSVVNLSPIANSHFPLTNIRSLTWTNATTVAVLAADSSSDAQPYLLSIDGSRVAAMTGALGATPVSVAAGPGSRAQLAVGTGSGIYVRATDRSWTSRGDEELNAPAYPS
jgi:hypothetical protein